MKITAADIKKQFATADEYDEFHGRHPDDIVAFREGIEEAKQRIGAWVDANRDALIATIQLYPDGEATKLWEALREHFWVGDEKPFKWRKP